MYLAFQFGYTEVPQHQKSFNVNIFTGFTNVLYAGWFHVDFLLWDAI